MLRLQIVDTCNVLCGFQEYIREESMTGYRDTQAPRGDRRRRFRGIVKRDRFPFVPFLYSFQIRMSGPVKLNNISDI